MMFSGLRHYPSSSVRIDSYDPVPRFIQRQWRGYQDEARDSLIRYKRLGFLPFFPQEFLFDHNLFVVCQVSFKYSQFISRIELICIWSMMQNMLLQTGDDKDI